MYLLVFAIIKLDLDCRSCVLIYNSKHQSLPIGKYYSYEVKFVTNQQLYFALSKANCFYQYNNLFSIEFMLTNLYYILMGLGNI